MGICYFSVYEESNNYYCLLKKLTGAIHLGPKGPSLLASSDKLIRVHEKKYLLAIAPLIPSAKKDRVLKQVCPPLGIEEPELAVALPFCCPDEKTAVIAKGSLFY